MINNNFNDIALKLMKSSAFCPICSSNNVDNKKNHSISAQVLESNEDKNILYLKCSNCGASMISIISLKDNVSAGATVFMTDLSPKEVMDFKKQMPISIKDIKGIKELIYK